MGVYTYNNIVYSIISAGNRQHQPPFGAFCKGLQNVKTKHTKLGGYMDGAVNGKSLFGVRQSMLYHALNGKLSYGQWLIACLNTKTPKPHNIGIPSGAQSATSPNVMAMLLCGGPSVAKTKK
mgnify:CR=1 FL=1